MNEITTITAELQNYFQDLQAIIFDLDDTLYLQKDFKISGFKAVAMWMAQNGYGARQEIFKELCAILEQYGPSYPFMFNRLLERISCPDLILSELIQIFTEHQPNIALFPGVRGLLLSLRKHFKLGILTDGPASVQRAKVRSLSLEPLVDFILYSDTLDLVKPAEQLFTNIETHFQLQGPNLVYVADNPLKDFIGAKKRKWLTIRILSGEYAEKEVHHSLNAEFTFPRITCLRCLAANLE